MYSGQTAIDFLSDKISNHHTDKGASSHWQYYHSNFAFNGESFRGLQGFGGHKKPYNGLQLQAHRLLQKKFRMLGATFPDFKAMDSLASIITRNQHRAYDLDVLRQVLTLSFLKKHLAGILPTNTVCVIGDGFASMSTLLLASRSTTRIILVNLSKTLLVDLWYLKLHLHEKFKHNVHLVTNEHDLDMALKTVPSEDTSIIAIQAEDHKLLRNCSVDLAINIASMQEMNPEIIGEYFDDFRVMSEKTPLYFYCCNREEKQLPDGTITRFSDYPWQIKDVVLIDELCPWHQKYYTIKPPFYKSYDGPIRHRLLRFA